MSQLSPTNVEANAYAENYVLYGDQTRAWRIAFPDSKAADKAKWENASLFHKIPKVLQRIAEINKMLKKQSEEEFGLTVSEIKKLLATAVKKGLNDRTDKDGNKIGHAVSISGAVSALNEMNRMDGNHAPTRLAHGGDPDAPPVAVKVTKTVIDGK